MCLPLLFLPCSRQVSLASLEETERSKKAIDFLWIKTIDNEHQDLEKMRGPGQGYYSQSATDLAYEFSTSQGGLLSHAG